MLNVCPLAIATIPFSHPYTLTRNVNTIICYVINIAPLVLVSGDYKWVCSDFATTCHQGEAHTAAAKVVGGVRTMVICRHVARYVVESWARNRNAAGFSKGHEGVYNLCSLRERGTRARDNHCQLEVKLLSISVLRWVVHFPPQTLIPKWEAALFLDAALLRCRKVNPY